MNKYQIEITRTYTTTVYVKCKNKKTLEKVLNDPQLGIEWNASTNLWDHIFEEEMEQCNVTDSYNVVDKDYANQDEFFDLDNELKKTNA
tara:strand:+ start:538 stop:804 length:267 start_codon:yes stop_codon:yes gene_type:complete